MDIPHHVDWLLSRTDKISGSLDLSIGFSQGHDTSGVSGYFTKIGLLNCSVASDFQPTDYGAPFLGALLALCCGNDDFQVSRVYIMYFRIVSFRFIIFRSLAWT